jgi:hypothetical protein
VKVIEITNFEINDFVDARVIHKLSHITRSDTSQINGVYLESIDKSIHIARHGFVCVKDCLEIQDFLIITKDTTPHINDVCYLVSLQRLEVVVTVHSQEDLTIVKVKRNTIISLDS